MTSIPATTLTPAALTPAAVTPVPRAPLGSAAAGAGASLGRSVLGPQLLAKRIPARRTAAAVELRRLALVSGRLPADLLRQTTEADLTSALLAALLDPQLRTVTLVRLLRMVVAAGCCAGCARTWTTWSSWWVRPADRPWTSTWPQSTQVETATPSFAPRRPSNSSGPPPPSRLRAAWARCGGRCCPRLGHWTLRCWRRGRRPLPGSSRHPRRPARRRCPPAHPRRDRGHVRQQPGAVPLWPVVQRDLDAAAGRAGALGGRASAAGGPAAACRCDLRRAQLQGLA